MDGLAIFLMTMICIVYCRPKAFGAWLRAVYDGFHAAGRDGE